MAKVTPLVECRFEPRESIVRAYELRDSGVSMHHLPLTGGFALQAGETVIIIIFKIGVKYL